MPATGTLSIAIRTSLLGQGMVTIVFALAIAVVFYLQLSLWIFLAVLLVTIVLWGLIIHRVNRNPWRRIVISQQGRQAVLVSDHARESGTISPRTRVWSGLVVLVVDTPKKRRRLWLFSDSADGSDWKRLVDSLRRAKASGK